MDPKWGEGRQKGTKKGHGDSWRRQAEAAAGSQAFTSCLR